MTAHNDLRIIEATLRRAHSSSSAIVVSQETWLALDRLWNLIVLGDTEQTDTK